MRSRGMFFGVHIKNSCDPRISLISRMVFRYSFCGVVCSVYKFIRIHEVFVYKFAKIYKVFAMKEVDWVEETDSALSAFEFKWSSKVRLSVVSRENFTDFVC